MELWLIFGILGYLFHAISTSIDKGMMNHNFLPVKTGTSKMLFDGIFVLIAGLLFFDLSFNATLLKWSLLLGFLYSSLVILYFNVIKQKDIEEVIPYAQSLVILLIFLSSIILFNETARPLNYLGVGLILAGVYSIISTDGLKMPKIDKVIWLILLMVIINVIYALLIKKILFGIPPINLAIMMYFMAAAILALYELVFLKQKPKSLIYGKEGALTVLIAAFFGGIGTLLLYQAVSLGEASKVFPLAGIKSAFIFIIATIFLKEKFYWHRLIGIITVIAGIALTTI